MLWGPAEDTSLHYAWIYQSCAGSLAVRLVLTEYRAHPWALRSWARKLCGPARPFIIISLLGIPCMVSKLPRASLHTVLKTPAAVCCGTTGKIWVVSYAEGLRHQTSTHTSSYR